ncbi:MAG: hypothetical protein QW076_04195 [Candidatus Anstonellales archaeon]
MHEKELLAFQMARQIIRAEDTCELESAISALHRLVINENIPLKNQQINITKKLISLLNSDENSPLKSQAAVNKAIDLSAKFLSLEIASNLAYTLLLSNNDDSVKNGLKILKNVKRLQDEETFIKIIKAIKMEIAYLTGVRTSYMRSELADKALKLLLNLEPDDVFDTISIMLKRRNYDYKKFLGWITALNDLVLISQCDYFMRENNQLTLRTLKEIKEELVSLYYYLYPSLKNQYYNNAEYLSSLKYINAKQFIEEVESEIKKDLESEIKNCGTYMIMVKVREGIYKINEILDLSEKYKKFSTSIQHKTNQNLKKTTIQRKYKL